MRAVAAFVLVVLQAVPALADDATDVEKLVRQHLGGDDKVLAQGATIVVHGALSKSATWRKELAGERVGMLRLDPDRKAFRVDGDVAWFHGEAYLVDNSPPKALPARLNGLAIRHAGTWKIAAIAYSRSLLDKDLFDGAAALPHKLTPPTSAAKLAGDTDLARVAGAWIDSGGLVKALPGLVVLVHQLQAPERARFPLVDTW